LLQFCACSASDSELIGQAVLMLTDMLPNLSLVLLKESQSMNMQSDCAYDTWELLIFVLCRSNSFYGWILLHKVMSI